MTTSTREDTPPAFWEGVLVSPLSFFLSFALSLPLPRPNFPLPSCLFVYLSVVCSIRGLFRCSSRSFFLSFVRSVFPSFFLVLFRFSLLSFPRDDLSLLRPESISRVCLSIICGQELSPDGRPCGARERERGMI